jgi:hypothetical protein
MADISTNGGYSEVFEDAPDGRVSQTIHHIRANSSIMQLKKILGKIRRQWNRRFGCDARAVC